MEYRIGVWGGFFVLSLLLAITPEFWASRVGIVAAGITGLQTVTYYVMYTARHWFMHAMTLHDVMAVVHGEGQQGSRAGSQQQAK